MGGSRGAERMIQLAWRTGGICTSHSFFDEIECQSRSIFSIAPICNFHRAALPSAPANVAERKKSCECLNAAAGVCCKVPVACVYVLLFFNYFTVKAAPVVGSQSCCAFLLEVAVLKPASSRRCSRNAVPCQQRCTGRKPSLDASYRLDWLQLLLGMQPFSSTKQPVVILNEATAYD